MTKKEECQNGMEHGLNGFKRYSRIFFCIGWNTDWMDAKDTRGFFLCSLVIPTKEESSQNVMTSRTIYDFWLLCRMEHGLNGFSRYSRIFLMLWHKFFLYDCHSDEGGISAYLSFRRRRIPRLFVIPTKEESSLICHSDKGGIAFANQAYLQ